MLNWAYKRKHEATTSKVAKPMEKAPEQLQRVDNFLKSSDEEFKPYLEVFEDAYINACKIFEIDPESKEIDITTMKVGEDMQFVRESTVDFIWTKPITNEYEEIVEDISKGNYSKYCGVQSITIEKNQVQLKYPVDGMANNVFEYVVKMTAVEKQHIVRFLREAFAKVPPSVFKYKTIVNDLRTTDAPETRYIVLTNDGEQIAGKHKKLYKCWTDAYNSFKDDENSTKFKIMRITLS